MKPATKALAALAVLRAATLFTGGLLAGWSITPPNPSPFYFTIGVFGFGSFLGAAAVETF